MRKFWNDGPLAQQSEMTDFPKNVVPFGASLVLLSVGIQPRPYAISL